MSFAPLIFSQETLNTIIDAVANIDAEDLSSVRACSLAARAFIPRSQYHIFAHVKLLLSDHGAEADALTCPQSDAERLIVTSLDPNPNLALLARSVTLTSRPVDRRTPMDCLRNGEART